MRDLTITALLFLTLLCSAGVGLAIQPKLKERHTSQATVDTVRLLMGMLITFSALVLGLLTSSAKERFDSYNGELSTFGTDLIELDHRLRIYGTDATFIREALRAYTAAAIADTWPSEPLPAGDYPRFDHAGIKGVERIDLGDMLAKVDVAIEQLAPSDEFHRQIAERLRNRVASAVQQRWRLIFSAGSTISWPFLLILTAWLSIIFFVFGLTAPRNGLVYVIATMAGLSIASPLYPILSYSGAQNGLLDLSSLPMRTALSHMDRVD